jgi:hypothetical protein
MCRCIGLVVCDRIDASDHVLEPVWSTCLCHLFSEVWVVALEVVPVAGQRPTLTPAANGERLPSEHRSVERPRPVNVTSIQAVEDHCTRVVD